MSYSVPDRSEANWDYLLQLVFNQVASDVQAAGTGTAKIRAGTHTERLALSSPSDGLVWVETDTTPFPQIYTYSVSAGDWVANLPPITSGDGSKVLTVKSDESGFELNAVLPAPIPLPNWQTNPDQYTVYKRDSYNSDGYGKNLAYQYVFPASVFSAMFMATDSLQFDGYDLQLNFQYVMPTAVSGDVRWLFDYKAVSAGGTLAAVEDWADWSATKDGTLTFVDTPSSSANVISAVSGSDLVIPASAYTAGDQIIVALIRAGTHESDTHTGDAYICDGISLQPAIPAV